MHSKNSFKKIQLIIAIISSIIVIIVFTTQIFQYSYENKYKKYILEDRIQDLKDKIDTLDKISIESRKNLIVYDSLKYSYDIKIQDTVNLLMLNQLESKFNFKIADLSNKINDLNTRYFALQQAINPLKPEEVLTIVRLKDEIIQLNKILISVNEKLEREQAIFEKSIIRELEKSDKSTILILVILIPLVLNFLYTVWKDYRENKTKVVEEQNQKTENE